MKNSAPHNHHMNELVGFKFLILRVLAGWVPPLWCIFGLIQVQWTVAVDSVVHKCSLYMGLLSSRTPPMKLYWVEIPLGLSNQLSKVQNFQIGLTILGWPNGLLLAQK